MSPWTRETNSDSNKITISIDTIRIYITKHHIIFTFLAIRIFEFKQVVLNLHSRSVSQKFTDLALGQLNNRIHFIIIAGSFECSN